MQVYWINLKWPSFEPRLVDVKIIQCEKTVWAQLPNGKRSLLGASSFFTLASAQRSRRALLQKVVDSNFCKHHQQYKWQQATRVLQVLH